MNLTLAIKYAKQGTNTQDVIQFLNWQNTRIIKLEGVIRKEISSPSKKESKELCYECKALIV